VPFMGVTNVAAFGVVVFTRPFVPSNDAGVRPFSAAPTVGAELSVTMFPLTPDVPPPGVGSHGTPP